ncbi:MAG: acyltransferase [bacterium]
MRKIKKIISRIKLSVIKKLIYINTSFYMFHFTKYLKRIGINVIGIPKFISSDVYFDGKDYSLITLGDNITISREVMFLTHDYSINVVNGANGNFVRRLKGEKYTINPITIGDNVFIGARVSLLPGSKIGNNCIIGACSVVKGNIPDNSIVIGNPCRIIKKIDSFENQLENHKISIHEED